MVFMGKSSFSPRMKTWSYQLYLPAPKYPEIVLQKFFTIGLQYDNQSATLSDRTKKQHPHCPISVIA